MTAADIQGLDPRARAAIDGLALIANALIVVYCSLALFVVRRGILRGDGLAPWVLGAGLAAVQVASYLADTLFFGGQNRIATHLSSLILLVGFSLCAWTLRQPASAGAS